MKWVIVAGLIASVINMVIGAIFPTAISNCLGWLVVTVFYAVELVTGRWE